MKVRVKLHQVERERKLDESESETASSGERERVGKRFEGARE